MQGIPDAAGHCAGYRWMHAAGIDARRSPSPGGVRGSASCWAESSTRRLLAEVPFGVVSSMRVPPH